MYTFSSPPSAQLAWFNGKGYPGTLSEAMTVYFQAKSTSIAGNSLEENMMLAFAEFPGSTVKEKLRYVIQELVASSSSDIKDYAELELEFFNDLTLDFPPLF